jgi:geranylgeranyl pyrophosphate synthase
VSERTEQLFGTWRKDIDAELGRVATDSGEQLPSQLRDAIRYSLTGEGKRFRGLLLMSSYEAVKKLQIPRSARDDSGSARDDNGGDASALAAAVEVVHAYSLVHDDLPCMDDDNVRRGRPTTHKAFDVATATVAGVAMVPLAVRQALRGSRILSLDDATGSRLVGVLMEAAGASGMIGGQILDLEGEQRPLSPAELESVHRAKTGALITASFAMGAIAGKGTASAINAVTSAGEALGLAFQIADDVLDATASSEALGKTAGKDAAVSKSTYVSTLGISAARERSQALVSETMSRLEAAGLRTERLEHLAHFVATRRS